MPKGDGPEPPIFENEYLVVKKSHLAGYGVFAKTIIPKDTLVLVESPLLIIPSKVSNRDVFVDLSWQDREIFYSLHAFHYWGAYTSLLDRIVSSNA